MRTITFLFVVLLLAAIFIPASTYTLDEAEQAVIIQFGAPVGDPVTEPGLHFKKPFVQEVRRFDKRLLAWDGAPNQIPTRGREFINVDTTARWRIADPLTFLKSVRDETGAQSRLDDIIDSVVRDKISSTDLVEIVRYRTWKVNPDDMDRIVIGDKELDLLRTEVHVGREQLEADILAEAQKQMPQYGIELVDVRIKRLNYIASVEQKVYQRMIAERQRVAAGFRSEGQGRAAEIDGQTQQRREEVLSEARREAEKTRGQADAQAIRIYNEAYSIDPEFFAFQRTLESYAESLGKDATVILGTDSDYFQYLRHINPASSKP